MKNWNCDGDHCTSSTGEVKLYPLPGGGNLILCHACWANENKWRFNQKKDLPQHDWSVAELYSTTYPIDKGVEL